MSSSNSSPQSSLATAKTVAVHPIWLTDEAGTVESLQQEIARISALQNNKTSFFDNITSAVPKGNSDADIAAKKKEHYKRLGELDSDTDDNPAIRMDNGGFLPNNVVKDPTHQEDIFSFLPNFALKPLTELIRSPKVLRKFLHKYVIARRGRLESAAERVLNLVKLIEQYPHLSIEYSLDVTKGLGLGCMECFPFKQCVREDGAVMIYIKFSRLDWSKINDNVELMEKTWFFLLFTIIMMPNHAAQTQGIVLQVDGEDCGPSNIKMAFEMFMLRLISQCLPVRMRGVYVYNAPRFIRWFVYPPVKLLLPEKINDRIFWFDDHQQIEMKVGSGDLHYTFGGHWRPSTVPSEADLKLISQWTTDGKVILPHDISERLDECEKGGVDVRDDCDGKVDEKRRRFY
jgi:hypothetical protein